MLELTHRFGENFGLAAWTSGPARAKILPLLAYAAGLVWVTASRRLRANLGVKLVWMAASAVLLFCWLFEGTKNFMYLPHILPWLCILAAIALTDIPRWAATLIVATVVSVQILSTAMPARRNPYGHLFVPAMDYLEQHTAPSDTIMGDAVIGFALGWNRNVSDDAWLGYKTGKKTDWIVITPVNASLIDSMRQLHPDVYRHVTQLLAGYSLAYENTDYKIYASARSARLTQ
jgi:hypothetical protein